MDNKRDLDPYEKSLLNKFKKNFYHYIFEIWEKEEPKGITEIFLGALCRIFDSEMSFIAEGAKRNNLRIKYMYPEKREIKETTLSLREEKGSYDNLNKAKLKGLYPLVAQGINSILFLPIKFATTENQYLFICNKTNPSIHDRLFINYDLIFGEILSRYLFPRYKNLNRAKLDQDIYKDRFQNELNTIIKRVVNRYSEELRFGEKDISEELQSEDRDEIEDLIKEAGVRIDMWFMPIFSLINRQIYGYEMLARDITAKDPKFPIDIFARAKTLGSDALIQLDCLCIRKVFEKIKRDGYPEGKFLFINIYPDILYDNCFEEILKERIEEMGGSIIPPWFLTFEIVETGPIEDYSKCRERIKKLLYYQINFADDDHGSGLATNERLLKLKPNHIKIGGDFIVNLLAVDAIKELVKGAARAGLEFGARVIAENIGKGDQSEQLIKTLKEIGVAFGQGYFFGKAKESPPLIY